MSCFQFKNAKYRLLKCTLLTLPYLVIGGGFPCEKQGMMTSCPRAALICPLCPLLKFEADDVERSSGGDSIIVSEKSRKTNISFQFRYHTLKRVLLFIGIVNLKKNDRVRLAILFKPLDRKSILTMDDNGLGLNGKSILTISISWLKLIELNLETCKQFERPIGWKIHFDYGLGLDGKSFLEDPSMHCYKIIAIFSQTYFSNKKKVLSEIAFLCPLW